MYISSIFFYNPTAHFAVYSHLVAIATNNRKMTTWSNFYLAM